MELFSEILKHYLSAESVCISFPDLKVSANELVEMQCYQALKKIKAVLDDHTLDDVSCFEQIEQIVCIFEELGSSGGSRHDFG